LTELAISLASLFGTGHRYARKNTHR